VPDAVVSCRVALLGPLGLTSILGLSLALFFLAAKTHGRQIRLERELEGYPEVTFGGDNPPWVVALWRRDRIFYWSTFAVTAAILGAYLVAAAATGLPLPSFCEGPCQPPVTPLLVGILLWTPIVAFIAAGQSSLRRFRHALLRSVGETPADRAETLRHLPPRAREELGRMIPAMPEITEAVESQLLRLADITIEPRDQREIDRVLRERGPWLAAARRGTTGYWSAVLVLSISVLLLSVL